MTSLTQVLTFHDFSQQHSGKVVGSILSVDILFFSSENFVNVNLLSTVGAIGLNMSQNGPKESKLNNLMPTTKSAQNKLRTPEVAIKLKIVHMVRIWAQRDQGNLLKSKLKFFMPKSKGAKNELKTPEQAIK